MKLELTTEEFYRRLHCVEGHIISCEEHHVLPHHLAPYYDLRKLFVNQSDDIPN
jgi:hypothetical protein